MSFHETTLLRALLSRNDLRVSKRPFHGFLSISIGKSIRVFISKWKMSPIGNQFFRVFPTRRKMSSRLLAFSFSPFVTLRAAKMKLMADRFNKGLGKLATSEALRSWLKFSIEPQIKWKWKMHSKQFPRVPEVFHLRKIFNLGRWSIAIKYLFSRVEFFLSWVELRCECE